MANNETPRLSQEGFADVLGDLGERLERYQEMEAELAAAEEARKSAHEAADADYDEVHERWISFTQGIGTDKDILGDFLVREPDIDERRKAVLITTLGGARKQDNPFELAQQLTEDIERLESRLSPGTPVVQVSGGEYKFGLATGAGIGAVVEEGFREARVDFFIEADNCRLARWHARNDNLDDLVVEDSKLSVDSYEIRSAVTDTGAIDEGQIPTAYPFILVGEEPIKQYVQKLAGYDGISEWERGNRLLSLYTIAKSAGVDIAAYDDKLAELVPAWKKQVASHIAIGIGAVFKRAAGMYCAWEEEQSLNRGYDKLRPLAEAFELSGEDIITSVRERVLANVNEMNRLYLYPSEAELRNRQAEILIPALVKTFTETASA